MVCHASGQSSDIANISTAVDNLFKNSSAETKTETEKAFYQSFISMSSALIKAMNVVSFVIIGIILLVLANTMAMTARERITEYAVMKTLGFGGKHLIGLIAGEALLIAILGGHLEFLLLFFLQWDLRRCSRPGFQISRIWGYYHWSFWLSPFWLASLQHLSQPYAHHVCES